MPTLNEVPELPRILLRKVSKGLGVRGVDMLDWIYHVRPAHPPQEGPKDITLHHDCEK